MSELDALDRGLDEALRRDGAAWRAARRGCPHPDLLMARASDVLDEALREAVRLHLDACNACRRLVADLDSLGLEDHGAEVQHRVRARVAARSDRRVPAWIATAAVIVLGVGAALWWTRSPRHTVEEQSPAVSRVAPSTTTSPPHPVALWELQPPSIRIPMTGMGASRSGAGGPTAGALADALEGFRSGRVTDSIAPLEQMARMYPDSAEASFYLGAAYLLSNRAPDAVGPLERARSLAVPVRRDEIDWYLATADQRTGRVDAARTRLQALCDARGAYRDRACTAKSLLR